MFLLATFAQAAYVAEKPNGEGTKDNPYQISKLENLLWMSENSRELEPGAYYSQTCDIDASETANWRDGLGFPPISSSTAGFYDTNYFFTGVYNGNNYTIDNLFIKGDGYDNIIYGLFSCVSNAFLCNIKLNNIKLAIRGGGSLAGYMVNSVVSNCHAMASFYQVHDMNMIGHIGGLVGQFHHSGTIIRSSAEVKDLKGFYYVGGLFALNTPPISTLIPYKAFISECFTKGNIGEADALKVGGIAGSTNAKCINCYTWCDVTGKEIVGGFAGECGNVENCYVYGKISEGGKAISSGRYEGKGVYYCSDNGSEDDRATGKTYAEMTHQATYDGWDFDNVWDIEEGESLPTLQWEAPEPGLAFLLLSMLVVPLARKK